jgi:hypothetical protein
MQKIKCEQKRKSERKLRKETVCREVECIQSEDVCSASIERHRHSLMERKRERMQERKTE